MASRFQEVRYSLSEESDKMATVFLFQSKVSVHVRQFYTDSYGEKRPGKKGTTLSVKEFYELLIYAQTF